MVSGVILYAGRDLGLVQTRRLVLEQAGYVVDLCDNTEDCIRKFLEGDFDLVLLCNSLRDGERERLSSLVRRFSARTPVICVCSLPEEMREGSLCTGEPQTILDALAAALAAAGAKPPAAEASASRARSRARF
jgi:DNA-binding NtrC family response regulator